MKNKSKIKMMIKKNKLFAREQTVEQDLSLSIRFDRLLIMSTCQSFDLIDYIVYRRENARETDCVRVYLFIRL